MKKLILFAAAAAMLVSCGSKPEKTIENLKLAISGESTASAKYAAYAQKAREEGYMNAANLFDATSKAEAIHAANHTKVLVELGVADFVPEVAQVNVATTMENLAEAQQAENYEIETMYPEYIAVAETEKAETAKNSFTWAFEAEKNHAAMYAAAMTAISERDAAIAAAAADKKAPAVEPETIVAVVVCPICGDTYYASEAPAACVLCGTASSEYLTFQAAPAVAEVATEVAPEEAAQ